MNTNKHKNSVSSAQSDKSVKVKFSEWERMLLGDDRHSIHNQIYEMIWDSAVFQCINESRKYAAKDEKGNDKRNEMLHSFINQSFFKTQLVSIRRLNDKEISTGKRSVYSLYRLVRDMKNNHELLTRGNILAFNNWPYDYEKAKAEFERGTDCTKGYYPPLEIAHSENIHRVIDSIKGISSDKRSSDDLLPDSILNQFEVELKDIEELCKYVDKYIAHAATPESRIGVPAEIDGALGKVLNAHRVICKIASFIGKLLFDSFRVFLSGPQYGQFDLFEYLDEPIASQETIEKLREIWDRYMIETEQWNQL